MPLIGMGEVLSIAVFCGLFRRLSFAGVTGGLRVEVIGITVDHYSPSNNSIHGKLIVLSYLRNITVYIRKNVLIKITPTAITPAIVSVPIPFSIHA